jgi:DNA-binding NarL/FixJ family response regulator
MWPMIRWSLVPAIAELEDVELTAKIRSPGANAPVVELVRHVDPQLVIVATGEPGAAVRTLTRLRARFASLELLGVTDAKQPSLVAELLRAGATGVAQSSQRANELLDAIRVTMRGLRYLAPEISSRDVERALLAAAAVGALGGKTAHPGG